MSQYSETLASLRDHYTDAVQRGDEDRAIHVAEQYRRITDRLISEDIPAETLARATGYTAWYRQRWQDFRDMPPEDLIQVRR